MTDPFFKANPGDPILSEQWNNMQISMRDEISTKIMTHTHKGGTDGPRLSGDAIDPTAVLSVRQVTAAVKLTVKDIDVEATLAKLGTDKLSLAGGTITGGLSVTGTLTVNSGATVTGNLAVGSGYVVKNGHLALGALSIGSITASFGGGTGWNSNMAGLVLETLKNTEIAVHDSGTRVASLMFYEGDADNRITIGRDMGAGWGAINSLDIRVAGAPNGWDRLVVTATPLWGDGASRYLTIGAGGATGIMLANPHVPWLGSEPRASIRYGRSGGVSSGAYWDVGARAGDAFSFALNGPDDHKMWLASNGNVGIGTMSPRARLEVANGAIMPTVGNSPNAGIQFPSDPAGGSSDHAFLRYFPVGSGEDCKLLLGINNDVNDTLGFWQYGAERMTVYNGCVGINTQTPSSTLDVNGSLNVQGFSWFRGGYSGSDLRLKQDITPVEDALEKVLRLRALRYRLRDSQDDAVYLGLIAQEVEQIFPEVVAENAEGMKGINYSSLVAPLIEAIKTQQRQLDGLRDALKTLTQESPA
ncbi:tail fiber domain-containing protein [Archangium violaceum]|uniref:tail fiber domain-containing protein n=1 Tax=Archangium violaceum TaxID=83451 RepID=UPI002B2A2335|nr:tail fiber domain-containing protein [Archangium gephyra]